jgi:ATP-dependent DNA helicase RecQ
VTLDELSERLGDTGRNKLTVALKILTDTRQVKRDRAKRYAATPDPKRESNVEAMLEQYRNRTRRDHEALERMIDYAQTGQCRWRNILAYFGEAAFDRCGTCDNCVNPPRVDPLPEPVLQDGGSRPKGNNLPDTRRPFSKGDPVRVRRYGIGEVQFSTADQVAVVFSDGTVRTFLSKFVKRVAA